MSLLTLQQVFGSSATQSSTAITFLKSELQGLTPQSVNTADSILAGIINNVWQNFEGRLTDQNGLPVTDQNGLSATYDNHLYYDITRLQFAGYYFPRNLLNYCFLYSQIQSYAY